MGRIQQDVRRQQRLEELCGAALRAMTGQADLHIRARGLYRGRQRIPLHAPHLHTDSGHDDLQTHRGATDGMALRLRHTDAVLHRRLCPAEPLRRLIFELLEQLRVESLVPACMPGMAHNLASRFESWSRQFHHSGLSDSALGILLYTLVQIAWARLNARQVLQETEDFIEATRAGIVPVLGEDLAALKRHRNDQAAYATAALSIASTIDEMISAAQAGNSAEDGGRDPEEEAATFKLLLDFDEGDDEGVATVTTGRSKVFEDTDTGYRIFDTRYDREVFAGSLVRPALLRELRERLDGRVREQGVNIARLSRQLAALFAQPQRDGWSFGEEEGFVDGRRLAQLISSPGERRLFRQERFWPTPHTLVSLLIDCSGSMKQHIESVAMLIDVLGRALQQAGVGTEVLGFSTSAWNGGRVRRDWLAKGRPPHPVGSTNSLTWFTRTRRPVGAGHGLR